ncbi:MAG: RNA polymerase sporulation sigma factor SigG [Clostridia bacterium]|nr:RNA polymerase sporulation sigma factor SigG [Clostridia bacterium]MDD4686156.1 RNA polymerase sporulation sigma factor SigG [Clostridia bacterium]
MANRVSISGVDTNKLPKLKSAELEMLMKKVKSGDELAREEFIVANLRLVLSVVHRFSIKADRSDDMFQVGCVGLLKAIDNFDITLGLKFSTYAVPMIIGEIRRYLRDNNSIRVSRSLRDIAYKALQVKDAFTKRENREPTIDEISLILEIPTSQIAFSLDAISDIVSLNEPVYNDGAENLRIMDQISDPDNTDENCLEIIALKDALIKLNPREKEILTLRYFIGKTQMEVSDEVGISQAQVSRLEKNALDIIRKNIT